jgi:hypothetical protein
MMVTYASQQGCLFCFLFVGSLSEGVKGRRQVNLASSSMSEKRSGENGTAVDLLKKFENMQKGVQCNAVFMRKKSSLSKQTKKLLSVQQYRQCLIKQIER